MIAEQCDVSSIEQQIDQVILIALNALAGSLKTNPALHLTIEGHTDNTGNSAHNLNLSRKEQML